MDGPLGAGRATLLKWLVEAGDRGRQDANAAQVRAKAVKALGGVVEVDTRVLGLQEMRLGLQNALQDEAVSVREAAVELLAKYLSSNPDLAAEYFDVICTACSVSLALGRL
jgi:cohesin loading factor subunit SCC2